MSKYLIQPNGNPPSPVSEFGRHLDVMEFFYDTVQGEGVSAGVPAAFLRLQGCTLDCIWCDTAWTLGAQYPFSYLFELMSREGLVDRFRYGHHLVITGGSPLKQQRRLTEFLGSFEIRYGFTPYIEVENECTLLPEYPFSIFVNQWNNSPKLSSSAMKKRARIKPEVLRNLSALPNSWFKFVVSCEEDWEEIVEDFLVPEYIRNDQIILMPLGSTREELEKTMGIVVELAIKKGVRFSNREQIILNKP